MLSFSLDGMLLSENTGAYPLLGLRSSKSVPRGALATSLTFTLSEPTISSSAFLSAPPIQWYKETFKSAASMYVSSTGKRISFSSKIGSTVSLLVAVRATMGCALVPSNDKITYGSSRLPTLGRFDADCTDTTSVPVLGVGETFGKNPGCGSAAGAAAAGGGAAAGAGAGAGAGPPIDPRLRICEGFTIPSEPSETGAPCVGPEPEAGGFALGDVGAWAAGAAGAGAGAGADAFSGAGTSRGAAFLAASPPSAGGGFKNRVSPSFSFPVAFWLLTTAVFPCLMSKTCSMYFPSYGTSFARLRITSPKKLDLFSALSSDSS
mmetsp:Transcript_54942/g.112180  ORF Transcript_54942/g.112180 Transcript_54942/m.112180 type:complete len:320 (-) Transcript_54942:296-1255(-)